MSESAETASSLSEGTDSRTGLHSMSHGLCTLSHVSYATQPRYCRNYALKIYDTRRNRRNAPSVARFSLSSHPWELISVYIVCIIQQYLGSSAIRSRGRVCPAGHMR